MSQVHWYCFVNFDAQGSQSLSRGTSSSLIHGSDWFIQSTGSRDLCTSRCHSAESTVRRDNKQTLTTSSIPEDVSSMPFDDRSGWILDPPSFIHSNLIAAPRSLDLYKNRLVLPMKSSNEVLELLSAKAANHQLPNHRAHFAKEQHDVVAHTSAITDISLVQVKP
jgi:hypothetical protein